VVRDLPATISLPEQISGLQKLSNTADPWILLAAVAGLEPATLDFGVRLLTWLLACAHAILLARNSICERRIQLDRCAINRVRQIVNQTVGRKINPE
jgi:hypothetical protein